MSDLDQTLRNQPGWVFSGSGFQFEASGILSGAFMDITLTPEQVLQINDLNPITFEGLAAIVGAEHIIHFWKHHE